MTEEPREYSGGLLNDDSAAVIEDDVPLEQDEPLPAPEDERDIDFPGEDVEPVSDVEP